MENRIVVVTGMFSVCISNYILPYMAGRKGCALLLANGLYEKWKKLANLAMAA